MKTAVPIGLLFGTLAACGISAYLHFGIGGEFPVIQRALLQNMQLSIGLTELSVNLECIMQPVQEKTGSS